MEEKVLFSFDEVAATSEANKLEKIRDKIQLVVDRFLKNVPKTSNFTIDEIIPFVAPEINRFGINGYGDDIGRQAKILLAKKIFGKNHLGGLPIVWETFITNVELPNTERIEQAIREARVKIMVYDDPSPLAKSKVVDNPLSVIQIDKARVELIPGTIESVHEGNKKYIETEEQSARLAKCQELAKVLNEASDLVPKEVKFGDLGDVGSFLILDESAKFEPNPDYVLTGFFGYEYVIGKDPQKK